MRRITLEIQENWIEQALRDKNYYLLDCILEILCYIDNFKRD